MNPDSGGQLTFLGALKFFSSSVRGGQARGYRCAAGDGEYGIGRVLGPTNYSQMLIVTGMGAGTY